MECFWESLHAGAFPNGETPLSIVVRNGAYTTFSVSSGEDGRRRFIRISLAVAGKIAILDLVRRLLCCCLDAQSCLTLCNHMDCSTPGLPALHPLPEPAQIQVKCIINLILKIIPHRTCDCHSRFTDKETSTTLYS